MAGFSPLLGIAPSKRRCARQVMMTTLLLAATALWLSRRVLGWSRIEPCLGDTCGQVVLDAHPSWRSSPRKAGNAHHPQSGHCPSSPCRAVLKVSITPSPSSQGLCVPALSSVSPTFSLQTCQGGPTVHPGGHSGSLSPDWQSHCCILNPDWCPDRGDRYHEKHPHKQTCGSAEGCLAGWLPLPESIFPIQKATAVALPAEGCSGRARSSGAAPANCRNVTAARS